MCGIVGALLPGRGQKVDLLPALEALRHRGPDGEGRWADRDCALAQGRLAIIDLSDAGQAPLGNEDGTVWVTFNGEIYNFRSLRDELEQHGHRFRGHSDTEVIVHAYEQWGTKCVDRFRGMFAFALWDQNEQRLFLARDRVGKKPLFYARVGDGFYFASELQGLLALGVVEREPDPVAIGSYLTWGYIPAPATGFAGIKKLPPAHTMDLRLRDGAIAETIERYWSLDYLPKASFSQEEASERIRSVLAESVRLRLISDVPLGAFLSGGVDSSIVVGLMAQESSDPVKTFSIGFEDEAFNELPHARRIAERWGTEHHEHVVRPDASEILPKLVRHYGEPFADSSAVPTYYVAQMTGREVKVALNGDGGDESFAGYERHWAHRMASRLGHVPGASLLAPRLGRMASRLGSGAVRRAGRFLSVIDLPPADRYARWMSYHNDPARRSLCTPEFLEASGSGNERWLQDLFRDTEELHPVDAAMSVDVRSYLPYDLLVKVDIAAMANSLEGRSPFLDHEVMEVAASLPVAMKLRGRSGKHLLKEAFADLLPPANVERRKMGFGVPVGAWFRGPLKEAIHDATVSEQALARGYFDAAAMNRFLDEHMAGRVDHGQRLWSLLMLEMWHREVVEAPATTPIS